MNRRLHALKQRQAALVEDSTKILEKQAAESRAELTAEEQAAFDKNDQDLKGVQAAIEREERLARYEIETGKAIDPEAAGPKITKQRDAILDDPKRGFKSLGDFGMSVYQAGLPGAQRDERMVTYAAITGASQMVGSDGGFLVPPSFSTAIWDGVAQQADSLLGRTDQYTVTGDSLTFNANAETSRATGSRWGGIRSYWIAEGVQMTSSKPTLRQIKLEPQQLAVLCYATDKLLRNAPAVEQWLTRAAIDEINFAVGDAIINGDGVGKPLGILSADCTIEVAKETGQGAATIQTENIAKMWARLHPKARANAAWFVNNEVEEQFDYMYIAVGTGGVPAYLPPGGLADAPYGRLKGRPVIPIEYCAALGTTGDIVLADLSAYATGLRGAVESASSIHLRFDYNETVFRFLFEIDGRPWLASAITPYKATSGRTLSTFVRLATRS